MFDIRSLDRRSPEAAGGNASGLHLHQTLTLVSIVRDAADCLALDVEQKGRDYSDQVTKTPYTVFRQGAELPLNQTTILKPKLNHCHTLTRLRGQGALTRSSVRCSTFAHSTRTSPNPGIKGRRCAVGKVCSRRVRLAERH